MTTPLPSVRSLFEQAVEIQSADARQRFLENACQGAPDTRAKVEALLGCYRSAGSFLESPAADLAPIWSENVSTDRTCDTDVTEQHAGEVPLDFLGPPRQPGHLGRLAHYEITEVIGRGGMGVVLKAIDEKLQRVVAIKVMAPQLATSASARKRFVREAQAAAAVRNDHVVSIYAVEESERLPYLVMECISGVTLQERLDQAGALDIAEVLRIGMQVAAGLAAAHAQGLIHRDIKPANILLENGVERVKITDFGLARVADDASLTQSGVLAGTPQYMSPEQADGQSIDHRSDLFSLGSLLYAMCTGQPPFRGQGTAAVLKRVCHDAPAPIRDLNPALPAGLVAVIEKLLAKSPSERYPSAEEVGQALRTELAALQRGHAVAPPDLVLKTAPRRDVGRSRPRLWAAAAAWLVLVTCGVGLSEVAGVTNFGASIIRTFTPDGTLVVEVEDPAVKVTVEAEGDLVITGAGPHEMRLKAGSYRWKATQNGQVIKQDLVEITRGGKRTVRVTREETGQTLARTAGEGSTGKKATPAPEGSPAATPPTAAPPPDPARPFVVLGGGNVTRGAYAKLAEAVLGASDRDTIEIRGNGPFLCPPIKIAAQALAIRAADGFVPVLRLSRDGLTPRGSALLETNGLLVLQGLDLQLLGFDPRDDVRCLFCRGASRAYIANCRLLANPRGKALFAMHNSRIDIRNSQVTNALIESHAARFHAQNNVLASPQTVLEVTDGSLRLARNTLVGKRLFGILDDISADDPAELAQRLQCEMVENVFDAHGLVLTYFPWSGPRGRPQGQSSLPRDALLAALHRRVTWRDSHNGYATEAPLLGLFINPSTTIATTTLADWQQFWSAPDKTSNIQGSFRFASGDVFIRAADAPEALRPEEFRLRAESAGYKAGPDGRDLGAEIDLVGPGAAYERWKKTPEYQQWLKDTGQSN